MTVTTSIKGRDTLGSRTARFVDVTLDASYSSGGWALTPKKLGLGTNGTILAVAVLTPILGGTFVTWDAAASKIKCYSSVTGGTATELTDADLLDALVVKLLVVGYGIG